MGRITIQTNDCQAAEVRTVWSAEEANELLASGEWNLMHGGLAHQDTMGYQAKPVYILCRLASCTKK